MHASTDGGRPVMFLPVMSTRGIVMQMPASISSTRALLARPTCPRCGTQMWLERIEPDKPDYDKRTFECPRCQKEVTEIVKYK